MCFVQAEKFKNFLIGSYQYINGDTMDGYLKEHFKRYFNEEYWRENHDKIIKTGFDFPKTFRAFFRMDFHEDTEQWDTYHKRQYEDEYYPILNLMEFAERYPEFKDLFNPFVLNYQNKVALIFSKPSSRWGLRGDPYFWMYLEDIFINASIPMDIDYFEKIIRFKYLKISGKNIGERAYIREFAHGGMSSGDVSSIWVDLIPLLKYRLLKLNNDYYTKQGEYSKVIENPEEVIVTAKMSMDEILNEYDAPLRL